MAVNMMCNGYTLVLISFVINFCFYQEHQKRDHSMDIYSYYLPTPKSKSKKKKTELPTLTLLKIFRQL
jgi:hypothetical protein